MNHLIHISDCSKQQIEQLIQTAMHYKTAREWPNLAPLTCTTLFYEDSTRTRVSFELAAKRLNMTVVNLAIQTSSIQKGESVLDTIINLHAMDVQFFVLRHQQEQLHAKLVRQLPQGCHLINAGSGRRAHPTQALLDAMTIYQHKRNFDGLKVAIVGDIKHSRVANSLQQILAKLGVAKLVFIAPEYLQPQTFDFGEVREDAKSGLEGADVIVCLRIQKERFGETESINFEQYQRDYSLTMDKLAYAKPDAIVMHPGPMNRGIEIADDVADSKQSVILEQANNGVFMRMAVLSQLSKA